MAETKPLYSTCVAVLGFICFVVGATAVGIPMWGYFDTPHGELLQINYDDHFNLSYESCYKRRATDSARASVITTRL